MEGGGKWREGVEGGGGKGLGEVSVILAASFVQSPQSESNSLSSFTVRDQSKLVPGAATCKQDPS